MTTLLIIIAVIFIALCVITPIIEEREEREEREYNKWAKKAYYEFNVEPSLFREYCKFARKLRGNKDVAHNAYLIAEEEWYDLNCK